LFFGADVVAVASTSEVFQIAMAGVPGPSVAISLSTASGFTPGATCTEQMPSLAATVAIPGTLAVAGTDVTANDQMVTVDVTKPVAITWKLATPGDAFAYRILLYELTNDGTTTTMTLVKTYRTAAPALSVPAGLLATGHTYLCSIEASTSHPQATSGDFVTFGPTVQNAVVYTHSFTTM
jgi:hypothetical protein